MSQTPKSLVSSRLRKRTSPLRLRSGLSPLSASTTIVKDRLRDRHTSAPADQGPLSHSVNWLYVTADTDDCDERGQGLRPAARERSSEIQTRLSPPSVRLAIRSRLQPES